MDGWIDGRQIMGCVSGVCINPVILCIKFPYHNLIWSCYCPLESQNLEVHQKMKIERLTKKSNVWCLICGVGLS